MNNPIDNLIGCRHNVRSRYTHGFYCRDCQMFFDKDSPTYRSDELLSSIWMVLNNINADRCRAGLDVLKDVADLKEEIGIGEAHENYEDIIFRAEAVISKYGRNNDSASITLSANPTQSLQTKR